ncbi:MAG: cadherin domain-containing protein [Bacteroidales bacterium]
MKVFYLMGLWLCLFAHVRAETQLVAYRYWFNNDDVNTTVIPLEQSVASGFFNLEIESAGVPKALNVLHWQVMDDAGRYSVPYARFFYHRSSPPHVQKITGYTFWFNQDVEAREVVVLDEQSNLDYNISFDASRLRPGMNAFHLRFTDAEGLSSSVVSRFFYRMEDGMVNHPDMSRYEYWFDSDVQNRYEGSLMAGDVGAYATEVRTDSLVNGLHSLNIRFADVNGRWSQVQSSYFMKLSYPMHAGFGIRAYEYWWDDAAEVHRVDLDEPVHPAELLLTLEARPLSDGLHTLHFRTCDVKNLWSVPQSFEVERMPLPMFSADQTDFCDKGVVRFINEMDTTGFDFHWDFGDGTTQVGIEAAHAYRDPGTYTVRMTALDRMGLADTSSTLEIRVHSSYLFQTDTTIQVGNGFEWRSYWLDQSGLYEDRMISSTGCDSVYQINLIVADSLLSKPRAILLSPSSVAENKPVGTLIGSFTAIDDDAYDVHTFRLVDGHAHNHWFRLVGNSLYTDTVFNYEQDSMYVVLVEVVDSKGYALSQFVEVSVTNVTEQPTALQLSRYTIAENMPVGSEIGQLSTVDPDGDDTFTYRLVSGEGDVDNDAFLLVGDRLLTAVALDYEQQNRYFVRIETRDANGLTFSRSFTIVVSNVPEGDLTAFTNLYLSNWMVAENQVPPVFVGKISAEGASASKAAFELVTGDGDFDNDHFFISNDSLYSKTVFDFEKRSIYFTRIEARDGLSNAWSKMMVVLVDDVNEHPYALYVSGFAVEEQAPIHSLVGTLMAFDPDLVDAHTFQLVSGLGDVHNSDFVIHQDSLLTNKVLSRTDGISRQVRVEVSDLAGATYVTTLQLVVNPSTELIQPTANAYMAFVDGSTLTVQIPSNALSQNTSIVLYNMLGQEVLRAPMESIHHQWTMDHLNKGIYLLQWMQADRPVQRMHIRH